MAEKRMFSKSIVLSDEFLDMPATTRCLYFTLSMLADDDGFVNSPKSIMRQCLATEDDLKILIAKKFLIAFETGIVVIRHWRINNYLRCDRYSPTKFTEEKALLYVDESGAYQKIELQTKQQEFVLESVSVAKQHKIAVEKAETSSAGKSEPKKQVPLIEREPKNEIEVVEKEYLLNYKTLYESGSLRSPTPIINWGASRKLTKETVKKYGVETVLEAVKNSLKSSFCVSKGYCLTTILSSGVLAALINGARDPPKSDLSKKYDLSNLVEVS